MRKVDVEISEDTSRPEGGYAIVLLRDVPNLPDRATFRIKPVDARDPYAGPIGEDWPRGDHAPVAVRQTEAGVELVIGPDIVECPALLPGAVGVIEVAAAHVRGEFLWPSIRPTARPRRNHLSVNRPQRGAIATPAKLPAAKPVVAVPPATVVASVSPPGLPWHSQIEGTDKRPAISEPVSAPAAPVATEQPLATLNRDRGAVAPTPKVSPALSIVAPPSATVDLTALPATAPAAATLPVPPPGLPPQTGQTTSALDPSATVVDQPVRAVASASSATIVGIAAATGAATSAAMAGRRNGRVGSAVSYAGRRAALVAACATVALVGGYLLGGVRSSGGNNSATGAEAKTTLPKVSVAVIPQHPAETPIQAYSPTGLPPADNERAQPIASEPASEPPARIEVAAASPAPANPAPTPPPARAPANTEVTLRIRGGGFQVTGELRGFDGAKYVIATHTSGVMTMDASRFECIGEACARPAAAILPQAERPNPLKPDKITIETASSLRADVVPHLIKAYAASIAATAAEIAGAPDAATRYRISDSRGAELATIDVAAGSTNSALGAIEHGAAVMAFTDYAAGSEDEQRHAAAGGARRTVALNEQLIGFDGVAVVASPKAKLAAVSIETLAKLFSGQITDWFELGAEPGPITLYLPAEGSGTAEAFNRLVLKPRGLRLAPTVTQVPSDADASDAVVKDAHAIALVSFGAVRSAKALNLETQCGLITRPTGFAVKTEEYPLARRLYLATGAAPAQPSARGLIRMASSLEAQRAITGSKLIDLSMTALPLADQSERMASAINAPAASFDLSEMRQMLADLAGYNRLSISLRFNAANDLDAKSRKEIARLAATLKEPEFAGKRVMLAGFTDAGGKFQANLTIGLKRAGQVRTALLAAGGPGLDPRLITTKGYGALAPVACNSTADGQRLNRRVEAWIADDTPGKNAAR